LTSSKPSVQSGKLATHELVRPAEPTRTACIKAPPFRWWAEVEQAFYGLSGGHAPPLIVTGNPTVTPHRHAGFLTEKFQAA
jgi:hypothetical protein